MSDGGDGKAATFLKESAICLFIITIDPSDKNLIIDGSSFKGKADKDFIIGTWWNHEIVQKKAQISAVSGRIIEQKVTFIGKEEININGKTYKTLKFNFSSSDPSLSKDKKLNTNIWYDEKTLNFNQKKFYYIFTIPIYIGNCYKYKKSLNFIAKT